MDLPAGTPHASVDIAIARPVGGRRWRATGRAIPTLAAVLAWAVLPSSSLAATSTAQQLTSTAGPRPTATAGALPVGRASYPVPAGALFVAPAGNDTATGTAAAPWRTLGHALSSAPSGATLVLRAGIYHENVTAYRPVTIQPYPGEEVWLDGSSPVTNLVADGARWRSDNYTLRFDHSPTYTPGAKDNTTPGWSFTNATYPMAAYPDQLFVDGIAQQQVSSLAQVAAGTFFVDTATSQLFMGSNPTGHQVRNSDLTMAITLQAAGSTLRGVGVRRYATAVPQLGTVRALNANATLENLNVSDNATQGIFVGTPTGSNITLNHVTADRNGLMGILANQADGLRAVAVTANGNNDEHFNTSPSSGGFKMTKSRHISLTGSAFTGNQGNGFWMDESTYDVAVTGNDFVGNAVHGVSFEISNKGVFADNLFAGNGQVGLKINNSGDSLVWNNTFVNNGYKPVWLVQDPRRASNLATPGHDPRQHYPDPTMTWTVRNIALSNNIFGRTTSNCLLCVEDAALHQSAATMGITADGDVYNRASPSSPTWLVVWASGATNPFVYTSLSAFRAATRQEPHGVELTGGSVLDSGYRPSAAVTSLQPTVAQPLDPAVAALVGHPAGERHLGIWLS